MRDLGHTAALVALLLSPSIATAKCRLQQIGVMPVDIHGLTPIVSTKINGATARFVLDTGFYYSVIWRDTAKHYQLPTSRGNYYMEWGNGGSSKGDIAIVKSLDFFGIPVPNVRFLVLNNPYDDPAGVMGQNLLTASDVEYDLANGIVRFFVPLDCEQQPLAYWAAGTPYTSVELHGMNVSGNHLETTAIVNGRRMTTWFDTASTHSYLTLDAAASIGITPKSAGVTFLGTIDTGLGTRTYNTWIAPIDSFQLGGEKVGHAHLLIARYESRDRFPDLMLGEDFFLSHRIFVAYSQKKIYFTYNGGPLFNLNLPQVISGNSTPPATLDLSTHASTPAAGPAESNTPATAEGFRRQGMAYASLQEFDRALADLTRACELAPTDADNYYERGTIYAQDKQFKSAFDDFNVALRLQPGNVYAHLDRAQLLQQHPEASPTATTADIEADLDAVSRLAAPDSGIRLRLGGLYGQIGNYSAGLAQIDQWFDKHPLRSDRALAFNQRCWLRATANRDLPEALDDCNHALDIDQDDPSILDSRALVNLRLGNLEAAISDYDSALDMNPNLAASLYGRGLAKQRQGEKSQGQADLAAAERLDSGIAKRFFKMGLVPD